MWQLSTRFCRAPYCFNATTTDHCGLQCPHFKDQNKTDLVANNMREAKGIALKTVRLHNLSKLEPLLSDSNLNMKVIVPIRDPRAVFASRVKLNKIEAKRLHYQLNFTEFMMDLKTECEETAESFEWYEKSRYRSMIKYIKFEDAVENYKKLEKDVFQFIGIENYSESRFELEETQVLNEYQKQVGGAYMSHTGDRNKEDVLDAWKEVITDAQRASIEEHCQKIMKLFKYEI